MTPPEPGVTVTSPLVMLPGTAVPEPLSRACVLLTAGQPDDAVHVLGATTGELADSPEVSVLTKLAERRATSRTWDLMERTVCGPHAEI